MAGELNVILTRLMVLCKKGDFYKLEIFTWFVFFCVCVVFCFLFFFFTNHADLWVLCKRDDFSLSKCWHGVVHFTNSQSWVYGTNFIRVLKHFPIQTNQHSSPISLPVKSQVHQCALGFQTHKYHKRIIWLFLFIHHLLPPLKPSCVR